MQIAHGNLAYLGGSEFNSTSPERRIRANMVAVFGFFGLVECQLKYSKRLCLFNLMVVLHLHERVVCCSIHVILHWNKVFSTNLTSAVFIIIIGYGFGYQDDGQYLIYCKYGWYSE